MIEAKQTHCGQYKRYGDFYREWAIQTDMGREETVNWCFENLYKRRVPTSEEWHKEIRVGGGHAGDYSYYFAGYYTISKIEGGYKFTICEPYAD